MTGEELDELLRDCPTLYHMATCGSWPSIRRHGLLSTSALLDRYGVAGDRRHTLEGQRRPESVALAGGGLEGAVIRDQKPMDDAGLSRCLQGGLSPEDWYRLLNGKVFFWLTPARLMRLMDAKPYRGLTHDVLEIDAASLVAAYRAEIALSPINSGATKPFPAPRGPDTFSSIDAYPYAEWRRRRASGERVVELTVRYGVPDIARFVRRVTRMGGAGEDVVLFRAADSGEPIIEEAGTGHSGNAFAVDRPLV